MAPSEAESDDHSIHAPAADDWPRGFVEASWWPLVTGLGIIGLYVGIGMYIIGIRPGETPVSPPLGVSVFVASLLVAVSGATGWTYHGFIARYWEKSRETNRNKYLWGMLLYFPVELALFGAGLLYFAFIYLRSWPPGELPPILTGLILGITVLLFTSAFTLYFAGRELRKENQRRFLALLAITPMLGIVFLAGKAANYYRLIVTEGYTLESGIYWSVFFGIDGLHGLLVAIGIVLLVVVLARALAGHITPDRHLSLTTIALYWWMLEAVWILLLVEIYGTAALCRATGPC